MVSKINNKTYIPTFLASSERPAIMINAAHHARELITI
jgi:predicted deacylase